LANYHLSIKIFSRGKGASAVAKAAYRAAECIKSEHDGQLHDYTKKHGIVHKEILLPENAPPEYAERAVLWNAVEKSERFINAQLAREIEISLPVELTREQNISLALDFAKQTFVNQGMCADVCVHDTDGTNPHAHIMLTMRPVEKDGKWGQKSYTVDGKKIPTVDWNDRDKAEDWRKAWADTVNAELKRQGYDTQIDHRSYERQGIQQVPTVHLGIAASQMERRGIRTELGDRNRDIEVTNKKIRQLRARINKLDKWLAEEAVNTEPPTFAEVIYKILADRGLKPASQMLIFLTENNIDGPAGLENKVKSMHGKLHSISEELKKVNRRIDTLNEHIKYSEYFKEHRSLKRQYDTLYSKYTAAKNETGFLAERKAKKALDDANSFYEANRAGLTLFDAADKYLRGVLQEHFDPKKLPPITMWRKELADKMGERDGLSREYNKLKEETAKVEQIKKNVAEIMKSEAPKQTAVWTWGVEL
jgi:hypothetical protein